MNRHIADRLEEAAHLLREQGADSFRVNAYLRAATSVRQWPEPVSQAFRDRGLDGLEELPGVGPSSERLHDELGIHTLEDLEAAAHDGRLATIAGFGAKRLAGIRDSLAQRLGRVRTLPDETAAVPSVAELLDVDHEYHQKAAAGELQLIAPRRFNPTREAWLPVLHTRRKDQGLGGPLRRRWHGRAPAHRDHRGARPAPWPPCGGGAPDGVRRLRGILHAESRLSPAGAPGPLSHVKQTEARYRAWGLPLSG